MTNESVGGIRTQILTLGCFGIKIQLCVSGAYLCVLLMVEVTVTERGSCFLLTGCLRSLAAGNSCWPGVRPIDQTVLQLAILLPQSPSSLDYRCAQPHPARTFVSYAATRAWPTMPISRVSPALHSAPENTHYPLWCVIADRFFRLELEGNPSEERAKDLREMSL